MFTTSEIPSQSFDGSSLKASTTQIDLKIQGLISEAQRLRQLQQYSRAIPVYCDARVSALQTENFVTAAEVTVELVECFIKLKQYSNAIAPCEEVLKVLSEHDTHPLQIIKVSRTLAEIFSHLFEPVRAQPLLERALTIANTHSFKEEEKQLTQAMKDLDKLREDNELCRLVSKQYPYERTYPGFIEEVCELWKYFWNHYVYDYADIRGRVSFTIMPGASGNHVLKMTSPFSEKDTATRLLTTIFDSATVRVQSQTQSLVNSDWLSDFSILKPNAFFVTLQTLLEQLDNLRSQHFEVYYCPRTCKVVRHDPKGRLPIALKHSPPLPDPFTILTPSERMQVRQSINRALDNSELSRRFETYITNILANAPIKIVWRFSKINYAFPDGRNNPSVEMRLNASREKTSAQDKAIVRQDLFIECIPPVIPFLSYLSYPNSGANLEASDTRMEEANRGIYENNRQIVEEYKKTFSAFEQGFSRLVNWMTVFAGEFASIIAAPAKPAFEIPTPPSKPHRIGSRGIIPGSMVQQTDNTINATATSIIEIRGAHLPGLLQAFGFTPWPVERIIGALIRKEPFEDDPTCSKTLLEGRKAKADALFTPAPVTIDVSLLRRFKGIKHMSYAGPVIDIVLDSGMGIQITEDRFTWRSPSDGALHSPTSGLCATELHDTQAFNYLSLVSASTTLDLFALVRLLILDAAEQAPDIVDLYTPSVFNAEKTAEVFNYLDDHINSLKQKATDLDKRIAREHLETNGLILEQGISDLRIKIKYLTELIEKLERQGVSDCIQLIKKAKERHYLRQELEESLQLLRRCLMLKQCYYPEYTQDVADECGLSVNTTSTTCSLAALSLPHGASEIQEKASASFDTPSDFSTETVTETTLTSLPKKSDYHCYVEDLMQRANFWTPEKSHIASKDQPSVKLMEDLIKCYQGHYKRAPDCDAAGLDTATQPSTVGSEVSGLTVSTTGLSMATEATLAGSDTASDLTFVYGSTGKKPPLKFFNVDEDAALPESPVFSSQLTS